MKEKIGIIGYGHLGSALDRGLTKAGYETVVNNGDADSTANKLRTNGADESKSRSLDKLIEESDKIALCIRSDDLKQIGQVLNRQLGSKHLILSFLAQTTLNDVLHSVSDKSKLVKVMTTLGIADLNGVSAIQGSNEEAFEIISSITAAGCLFKFDSEEEMQLFTVAVGCFPGLISYYLDQLRLSIKKQNGNSFADYEKVFPVLLSSVSTLLTNTGSTHVLQEKIATKGGVTQAMIKSMEKSKLETVIDRSVEAGLERMQLSNKK